MITTCVASTDRYLTTTAALKLRLGVTGTSDDALYNAQILAASRWAESYLDRPLTLQSYSETLPSYDRRLLTLTRIPVTAVDRVLDTTSTEDAQEVTTTEYRVEDREAGFLSRDLGWEWTAPAMQGGLTQTPAVGQEWRPWLVDYRAGYVYGGLTTDSPNWSTANGTTSTGRTLPEDIEEAVLLRAVAFNAGDADVIKERLGDLEVWYNARSAAIDPRQAQPTFEVILDQYRGWVP